MQTETDDIVVQLQHKIALLEAERDQLLEALGNKNRNAADTTVVERAKTKLMIAYGWNEERAFRTLQRAAMDKRIPVPVEAQRILDTLQMVEESTHDRRRRLREPRRAGRQGP